MILYVVIWGGIQDSELLVFRFFLAFLTWSFWRCALIAVSYTHLTLPTNREV